jgi:methylamine dehydrogenase accessory protein MauD
MNTSIVAILVLQWLAIFGLSAVVFALVRQIGLLHQRIAPAGALMISEGIKIGAKVPKMVMRTLDGSNISVGGDLHRHSTLIMFVAPDCPLCATLIPALINIGKQESDWLRIIFASDGKEDEHKKFSREKKLDAFPYVISTELGMTFQVAKLPYGVLIDENGVLVSQGLTNTREHVESLFEAKRLNVASIQDYLARSGRLPG